MEPGCSTGHEVIRVPLKDGKASGIYEDFSPGCAG